MMHILFKIHLHVRDAKVTILSFNQIENIELGSSPKLQLHSKDSKYPKWSSRIM